MGRWRNESGILRPRRFRSCHSGQWPPAARARAGRRTRRRLLGVSVDVARSRTPKPEAKRTKAVIPLRLLLWGSKDSHLAHTLDVSNHGVKLGGCQGEVKVGDKIEIQYHHTRAQFRVAWITATKVSSGM